MKINSRHYILILFALTSIAITIFAYVFIYEQSLVQANKYISAKKEVESQDSKKQNEEELVKVYNSTKESRAKILSFLVHEDRIVDFIETIEKIGTDSHTKLELSTINNDNGIIKAKIDAKGNWSGIITALSLIENLPLSVTVKNVRLNVVGGLDKVGRAWELTLDIEALSIKS